MTNISPTGWAVEIKPPADKQITRSTIQDFHETHGSDHIRHDTSM